MSSESSSSLLEGAHGSRPRRRVPAAVAMSRVLKQAAAMKHESTGESPEDESDECTESDLCHSSSSEESSDADNGGVIYMDYNATTPLDRDVLTAIQNALKSAWGNPSSNHQAGIEAKKVIMEARQSVAAMIGCTPEDIIFTSGGTEANNLVIHSAIQHFHATRSTNEPSLALEAESNRPHIVTTSLEHDSIKLVLEKFQEQGKIDVTFVGAAKGGGCVSPEDIVTALRPSTCLVTVMLANNETGILQPVSKIFSRVRQYCIDQARRPILLHTDAAQAIGKVPVDVDDLGVDYLTIVGHKFYGPRIGALFVRQPHQVTPVYPMFYGGGQERSFRPGTENTGMIAGLGKACELVRRNVDRYCRHMSTVRDYLEKQLEDAFPRGVHFNGRSESFQRLPNTCSVSILGNGLLGYQVLGRAKRLQASLGAACHSELSHRVSGILLASGVPEEIAVGTIRLSIGRHTTLRDVDTAVGELKLAVDELTSAHDKNTSS